MIETSIATENKIKRQKRKYGLAYGIIAGLAYAAALWGYDGALLSQAHAYYPWIKLIAGGTLAMLAGGLAGWLTVRFEKGLLGVLFWMTTSGLLTWLTLIVPFVLAPFLMGRLSPELHSLLKYEIYPILYTRVSVAFMWVLVAAFIIAVIQIPLADQAVFSVSLFGKLVPYLVCASIMGVSGIVADNLNNQPLRLAILALDNTIQFSLDTRGQDVDPKLAREMQQASLRPVKDIVTDPRWLAISRYDQYLDNIYVLANFDGNWMECGTIYGHVSNCILVTP